MKRKRVDSPQVMALKKPRDDGQEEGKQTSTGTGPPPAQKTGGDLSAGVYKAFVKNALDEVEKVSLVV